MGKAPKGASFIGLDLAWKVDGKHSGAVVLTGDAEAVSLRSVATGITSRAEVFEFIETNAGANTVLAVDCSLVVTNSTGQRPCETAVAKAFGRYHASCHTTNRNRPYWNTGPDLVRALCGLGFAHDFNLKRARQRHGRWLFEVYPHPSMVRLFGLERIVAYKKGNVAEKRAGLARLRGYLGGLRGLRLNGKLRELLGRDLEALRGEALKRYEDTLDALFCAYLAWHCWKWGSERNEMFGTLEEGYIVVAKGSAQSLHSQPFGRAP